MTSEQKAELIEAINSLDGSTIKGVIDAKTAYITACVDIVDIIQSRTEQQVLDKPDSKGLWIKHDILDSKPLYSLWEITHDGIGYFARMTVGFQNHWTSVNALKGKWIKAIVPESEVDNE